MKNYKKILTIFLMLIITFTLVSCISRNNENNGDNDNNNNDDDNGDILDPNEIVLSKNIKKIKDENDPNFLGGYKYVYTGEWSDTSGEYPSINGDFKYAGLYDTEGNVYQMPKENEVTGFSYNVLDFGMIPDDPSQDNTPIIKSIIDLVQEGDEIYFPEGRYYFKTYMIARPLMAHISLPSGVNLRGDGQDKTTLVSNFDSYENTNNDTTIIGIVSESNIKISNLSLDAEIPFEKMPQIDPKTGYISTVINNPEGNKYVPKSGIKAINTDVLEKTENIVVDNVLVEHFSVSGVYFKSTIASTVKNSTIRKASDVGGGGRGYGITVEGQGPETFYNIGGNLGSRYNVVRDNYIEGPYIRHAIILSYGTHNNLIYNNKATESQDQTLDLHGQDEFLNVFSNNDLKDGAKQAIGLGNTGFTHDLTGPGNIFYRNKVDNYQRGVTISYGTLDSVIIENEITNLRSSGIGIDIMFGPNSIIEGNKIDGIIGGDSVGIYVKYSYVYYNPSLGVYDVYIRNNDLRNIPGVGINLEIYGDNSIIENNTLTNVNSEIIDTKISFEVPEKSDYTTEVVGTKVYPEKEANINRGNWDTVVRNRGYFWFKGSELEREFNRMIYYNWNLEELKEEIDETSKIVIRLTVTSKSALQSFTFYGIEDFGDEWDELTMTWSNAPFVNNPKNNSELEEDPTGEYSTLDYPYLSEVYDPNEELTLITEFTLPVIDESYITYYIDITDYVKSLNSLNFTMILADPSIAEAYSSVRNMIGNLKEVWPAIIIEKPE